MNETESAFQRLYAVIVRLRGPDGCPWDREQTPYSLRECLIEETYECVEAITENRSDHVKEELGDIFLLAVMLSYMYEQAGAFSAADALQGVCEKLIRRHPHVFGDKSVRDSSEVLANWAKIKVEKEGRPPKDSLLDAVSSALPPLERAYALQKKAGAAGFDWSSLTGVMDKLAEETGEARSAAEIRGASQKSGDAASAEAALREELGDVLFSAINVCRFLGFHPAAALQDANRKFVRRFKYVEKRMKESGALMDKENLALMDAFWEEAKKERG
ncbi:MAG: nucleoside triphosphate pyrophosphohydrolase [Spirochaetaceae bacterium]|jgi:tetrapyrrole methylase family protein/MazG family protein|nr:nucleoside triphosphate pyrophosphohydrolase [Spirochaetaceae bacterium]